MNIVSEYVTKLLAETLDIIQNDNDPLHFWTHYNFKGKCYCRSAVREMLELISKVDIPPLMILEMYRDAMARCAKLDPKTSVMFTIGEITANYFIGMIS